MRPSAALSQHRETIRRLVAEHGMSNPRLFGSVLHGEDTEESDLDIVIDKGRDTSLFDLARLQLALEAALEIKVDVRLPGELHRGFRADVLAEAMPV